MEQIMFFCIPAHVQKLYYCYSKFSIDREGYIVFPISILIFGGEIEKKNYGAWKKDCMV